MLVACDWVSIRHEMGIRLEYKSTRNVPVLKEASSYTAILAGSTFLLILSSVVELSRRSNSTHGGRKSYRGRIVAVSATPEAAHILTFAHTVRPEIRMERSPPTTPACCPQVSHSRPLGDTKHAKDTCGNFAIGQQSR
jgi:hypothetical protein